ncbi:hypothetical protein NADFUDRAFT_83912, partial [Nadsonia fulvescens var. elongata DSM 6958]
MVCRIPYFPIVLGSVSATIRGECVQCRVSGTGLNYAPKKSPTSRTQALDLFISKLPKKNLNHALGSGKVSFKNSFKMIWRIL